VLGGRAGTAPTLVAVRAGGEASACSRGSRYRHEAAAYDPLADKMVDQLGFAVDRAGFERFGSFLERPAPDADQVVIGLEATGNYTRR